MTKISAPTKSFIILFCLAIAGTYFCLMLWSSLGSSPKTYDYYQTLEIPETMFKPADQTVANPVDTSSWKAFSNPDLHLSFKYKPDWKILPLVEKDVYKILQIDPGAKFYNIKIYISPKGYYALEGLPVKNTSIAGQPALNVNNMLYGVTYNNTYYTFDLGLSLSLKNDFVGMVKSVEFR